MSSELSLPRVVVEERHFMMRVFGWMSAGLALTGGVAAYVASTPALAQVVVQNRLVFFGLIIFQLVLVFRLASVVQSDVNSTVRFFDSSNRFSIVRVTLLHGTNFAVQSLTPTQTCSQPPSLITLPSLW